MFGSQHNVTNMISIQVKTKDLWSSGQVALGLVRLDGQCGVRTRSLGQLTTETVCDNSIRH